MNIKFALLLSMILLLSFASQAQETPKTETPKQAQPKYTAKDYEDLTAKLKGGETSIDYKALRLAFTETKNYSFSGPEKAEREKFYKPFGGNNYKEALKQAEKYLETNYVDAEAHYVAYKSAAELKDAKTADFHKAVLLGLLNSIKDGHDGLSAKTPFFVITTDEEYTMMRFLGYQVGSQSLNNLEGHTFDVLTGTDSKTKENVKIFFNIDVVWAAENKLFGQ